MTNIYKMSYSIKNNIEDEYYLGFEGVYSKIRIFNDINIFNNGFIISSGHYKEMLTLLNIFNLLNYITVNELTNCKISNKTSLLKYLKIINNSAKIKNCNVYIMNINYDCLNFNYYFNYSMNYFNKRLNILCNLNKTKLIDTKYSIENCNIILEGNYLKALILFLRDNNIPEYSILKSKRRYIQIYPALENCEDYKLYLPLYSSDLGIIPRR